MKLRAVLAIQRFLTIGIPCMLVAALWYAMVQSADKQLVFIPYSIDDRETVEQLKADGYLDNPFMYAAISSAVEFGVDIESGGYTLSKMMGPFSMLAALTAPEYKYISFYEGLRREEVADIVGDKLNWDEAKKLSFATTNPVCTESGGEGYLKSGQYIIHKDETPEHVRKRMEAEMFAAIDAVVGANNSSASSKHEIVTIASLIQREAAGKHDMNIISGVIQNRINKGMRLQIDATLQYIKADGEEDVWWPLVNSEDKYLDSPYNTYRNAGLPPSPIASPGESALAAATYPIKTDCLFYIHDRNRVIHCASNYDDHKRNIAQYLK